MAQNLSVRSETCSLNVVACTAHADAGHMLKEVSHIPLRRDKTARMVHNH